MVDDNTYIADRKTHILEFNDPWDSLDASKNSMFPRIFYESVS